MSGTMWPGGLKVKHASYAAGYYSRERRGESRESVLWSFSTSLGTADGLVIQSLNLGEVHTPQELLEQKNVLEAYHLRRRGPDRGVDLNGEVAGLDSWQMIVGALLPTLDLHVCTSGVIYPHHEFRIEAVYAFRGVSFLHRCEDEMRAQADSYREKHCPDWQLEVKECRAGWSGRLRPDASGDGLAFTSSSI